MPLSEINKVAFYKYLNADISIHEFEMFVYHQPDLEMQLEQSVYDFLLRFDYNSIDSANQLTNFIKSLLPNESDYEIWRLTQALNRLITEPDKLDLNLQIIYDLYCGELQPNGQRKYAYKFLQHIGLNFLWWAEEGYLRTTYGDRWKEEYKRIRVDFNHYHRQLKPFADKILSALNDRSIVILNDGTYTINASLKQDLESGNIYALTTPFS